MKSLAFQSTEQDWKEWGQICPHYFNYWGTLCLANNTQVRIEYKIESGKFMYRGTIDGMTYMMSVEQMEGEANKGYAKYKFTHRLCAKETYRFNLPMTVNELG